MQKEGNRKMTTGEVIKYYRKQAGLTQAQLAEKAGVCHSLINKYETNKTTPKFENANKIAEVLNISTGRIIPIIDVPPECYEFEGEFYCAEDALSMLASTGKIFLFWKEETQSYKIVL